MSFRTTWVCDVCSKQYQGGLVERGWLDISLSRKGRDEPYLGGDWWNLDICSDCMTNEITIQLSPRGWAISSQRNTSAFTVTLTPTVDSNSEAPVSP